MEHFDEFFQGVLHAAIHTSTHEGEPLGSMWAVNEIHPDDLEILRAHALSFFARTWFYIIKELGSRQWSDAGVDFWLTSQKDGAGFWDGDWPVYGEMLTNLSQCYPEQLNLSPDDEGSFLRL